MRGKAVDAFLFIIVNSALFLRHYFIQIVSFTSVAVTLFCLVYALAKSDIITGILTTIMITNVNIFILMLQSFRGREKL